MSEPNKRFEVVIEDPPLLKALLLCAGDDPETISVITRAYHTCLEGQQASPFVMSSVLLSAIGNAILHSQPSPSSNGVSPGQLKSTQLESLAASIRALPNRDDLQQLLKEAQTTERAGDNKVLTAFLDDWSVKKAYENSLKIKIRTQILHWLLYAAMGIAIAASGFFLGYFYCSENYARIERANFSQSANR